MQNIYSTDPIKRDIGIQASGSNPFLPIPTTNTETPSMNENEMNILYYSNYCKHSQKVVKHLVKAGLGEKIRFICVDQRKKDGVTSQTYILLSNGTKTLLPPNIHLVPSLLLISEKFRVITGDEIIAYYEPHVETIHKNTNPFHGEPTAFDMNDAGNSFIKSEKFTLYNSPTEELGISGKGTSRQLHNYVKAIHEPIFINTPPDTYTPDKISNDITLYVLQQKRNEEVKENINLFGEDSHQDGGVKPAKISISSNDNIYNILSKDI
jgi:hypothetical protein